MKHGLVIQFRLNPEDVMSCIDVLDVSGIPQNNMSLPMVCRLVLSSYLQGSRDRGMIPKREGYEYTAMVERFSNISVASKIAAANNIFNIEVKNHIAGIENKPMDMQRRGEVKQPVHTQAQSYTSPDDMLSRKRGRVEIAIDELEQRRMIDELNFTQAQTDRLVSLHAALVQLNNDVDVDIRALFE